MRSLEIPGDRGIDSMLTFLLLCWGFVSHALVYIVCPEVRNAQLTSLCMDVDCVKCCACCGGWMPSWDVWHLSLYVLHCVTCCDKFCFEARAFCNIHNWVVSHCWKHDGLIWCFLVQFVARTRWCYLWGSRRLTKREQCACSVVTILFSFIAQCAIN